MLLRQFYMLLRNHLFEVKHSNLKNCSSHQLHLFKYHERYLDNKVIEVLSVQ